ncbi:unnamed protein product, partial [Vitis vinifera]
MRLSSSTIEYREHRITVNMADALLSASLQALFDRLASPELMNFIRGQKLSHELLNKLKRKLLVVHKVLNDAEMKQFSDPLVKEWLFQVKDAVYHAEDLLDEIATEALRCEIEAADSQPGGIHQVCNKFSTRVKAPFSNQSMESRVKEMIAKLEDIAQEKVELGLKEGDGERVSPKLPSSSLVEESFFLLIGVTKSILGAIGCRPTSDDSLDLLQRQLKDNLGNKKFLLVLDDIWDVKSLDWESWDRLRTPLLAAAQGSKIVVTSRSETVAKVMRAIHTHQLGTLSPEDSWYLFTKLAFPNGDPCAYPQLEPIGREIVKKCQGLPLAVKALGSLLYSKPERREWEDILNSKTWHSQTDHEILPSLRLSYRHLSLPVKRCFAYCSIFPKDYEFHKEKLILLWMAEGLLHSGQSNRRMEEVGDSYFNELLAKSFFQKCIREEESCFVMHDLIHDLAQHISQEFCIRLEDCKLQKISDKARHFLHFKSDEYPVVHYPFYQLSTRVLQNILPKFKSLRVLSLCEYYITDVPNSIHNLKQLRYLDLSATKIKRLPESICCLCYLQTMMLRNCQSLLELPSKMGKLINLRYLDVSETDSLKEMPNDMDQLKSLQKLPNFTVGQKSGFGFGELWKLSEIRGRLEISKMENVVGVEDALQANMKDKKYLDELSLNWSRGISHDAIQDDILNRLTPHPNLEKLSIQHYPGLTFPDWLGDGSFSNLVSLQLSNCGNCSTLPPLGQLPCLEHIEISEMKGVVRVGSEFYGNSSSSLHPSFPSLQTLSFEDMSNWEKWLCCGDCLQLLVPTLNVHAARELQLKRQTFGLPSTLKSLSISDCTKLDLLLPKLFRCHHPVLENLSINGEDCPELLLHREGLPSNLRELAIVRCNQLTSQVDWDLQKLTSLTRFIIQGGCEGVELFSKECLLPSSLTYLSIYSLPNLKSLDNKGLQQLTSLLQLHIENCPELQFSTRSVLQRLISLKELRIYSCKSL